MDFLTKLDRLMEENKLNKRTLSQQSGIPYTTIVGLYERGIVNARLSTINALCDFFDVPMDYLVIDKYEKPEDFVPSEHVSSIVCDDPNEIRLVTAYRAADDRAREDALRTLLDHPRQDAASDQTA